MTHSECTMKKRSSTARSFNARACLIKADLDQAGSGSV